MKNSKTYLITGAASGIGAATAILLSKHETTLILHSRKQIDRLEIVAEKCRQKGASVKLILANLSEEKGIAKLTQKISEENSLDGIIHCAGFVDWHHLENATTDHLQSSFDLMQKSFFSLTQSSLALLRQSESARIIAVSSFLAHKFHNNGCFTPISAAAKAGLEALVTSFAAQLAEEKITVNAVVPGYIQKDHAETVPESEEQDNTPNKIPMKRLGQTDEVAELIAFLLSDKASYITGQAIHIDGGLCL